MALEKRLRVSLSYPFHKAMSGPNMLYNILVPDKNIGLDNLLNIGLKLIILMLKHTQLPTFNV